MTNGWDLTYLPWSVLCSLNGITVLQMLNLYSPFFNGWQINRSRKSTNGIPFRFYHYVRPRYHRSIKLLKVIHSLKCSGHTVADIIRYPNCVVYILQLPIVHTTFCCKSHRQLIQSSDIRWLYVGIDLCLMRTRRSIASQHRRESSDVTLHRCFGTISSLYRRTKLHCLVHPHATQSTCGHPSLPNRCKQQYYNTTDLYNYTYKNYVRNLQY